MTTEFIDIKIQSIDGATSVTVVTPDHQEGDLLVFTMIVGGVVAEAATLTLPVGWTADGSATSGTGALRMLRAFKYAELGEPAQLAFGYTDTRALVGSLVSIRGAARDYDYDPVNFPYGYYAPGGSTGTSASDNSATLNPSSIATTTPDNARVLYTFAQWDPSLGAISFDDPVPLTPIRVKLTTAIFPACIWMDDVYDAPISPAPQIVVASNQTKQWLALATAVESFESIPESVDNYKSKLLRRTLPPPYDTRLASKLGKLLAIIGTSDNDIGGLFGDADFLPDEET